MASSINLNALIIALVAWACSYLISSPLGETNQYYYVVLMIVDVFFMSVISWSTISNLKKRYMTTVLFISAIVSAAASMNEIFYSVSTASTSGFFVVSWFALFVDSTYSQFSFIMSCLLCVASITPKGILNAIDARFWPSSLDFIYYSYSEREFQDTQKSAWDSRRGRR